MEYEKLSGEIDRLVSSGATESEELNIDLESFHSLHAVEQQVRFLQKLNFFLIFFLALIVCGCAAVFFIFKKKQEQRLSEAVQLSSAIVDTIENLKAMNDVLRQQLKDQQLMISTTEKEIVEVTFHDVRKGETIFMIAKKYYGDAMEYRRILKANNLPDPPDLKTGMRLKIILPTKEKANE